ncbi:hypothetical protein HW561_07820 [Rhodobacteraceae bacterium B1Z28]|uniref:Argininosuccinate lyase n=1 Tax=Ruegeria haliotis TaxID=2747601 RepID=A0ABX2PNH3_9RHOB|nr:hypothetical protein [Ruegeria haliotis]NVO55693.1 hypothetical protein [Ruegeria haliotis]
MKSIVAVQFIAAVFFATAAHAEDLEFVLVNDSSSDLVEFNVSPASSGNWEGDLLDSGYLAPNYEVGVLIADGLQTCVYDIRGVFDDGSSVEDYSLDLCDLGEYTFLD